MGFLFLRPDESPNHGARPTLAPARCVGVCS
jgi:hypothetical protein